MVAWVSPSFPDSCFAVMVKSLPGKNFRASASLVGGYNGAPRLSICAAIMPAAFPLVLVMVSMVTVPEPSALSVSSSFILKQPHRQSSDSATKDNFKAERVNRLSKPNELKENRKVRVGLIIQEL